MLMKGRRAAVCRLLSHCSAIHVTSSGADIICCNTHSLTADEPAGTAARRCEAVMAMLWNPCIATQTACQFKANMARLDCLPHANNVLHHLGMSLAQHLLILGAACKLAPLPRCAAATYAPHAAFRWRAGPLLVHGKLHQSSDEKLRRQRAVGIVWFTSLRLPSWHASTERTSFPPLHEPARREPCSLHITCILRQAGRAF